MMEFWKKLSPKQKLFWVCVALVVIAAAIFLTVYFTTRAPTPAPDPLTPTPDPLIPIPDLQTPTINQNQPTTPQIQVPNDDPWRNSGGEIVYANANDRCIVTNSENKSDIWNCDGGGRVFRTYQSGEIKLDGTEKCMTMNPDKKIVIATCNNTDDQKWSYDEANNIFRNVGSGDCLTSGRTDLTLIGGGLKAMPCDSPSGINTFKRRQIVTPPFVDQTQQQPPLQVQVPMDDPWRNSGGEIVYADANDRCIVTNPENVSDIWNCDGGGRVFRTYPSGEIKLNGTENCMTASPSGKIVIAQCNNDPSQKWSYDATNKQFVNVNSGQCLTSGRTDTRALSGGLKLDSCRNNNGINKFVRK